MVNKSILEVVHESAKELNEVGLMKDVTLREFNDLCMPSIEEKAQSAVEAVCLDARKK